VVANFDGTYHAILGHPSLTKFMAVPHYSYLVLKMPTEKGVLTVRGNVYTAYTYEEKASRSRRQSISRFAWQKLQLKPHNFSPTSSKYPNRRLSGKTPSPKSTRR